MEVAFVSYSLWTKTLALAEGTVSTYVDNNITSDVGRTMVWSHIVSNGSWPFTKNYCYYLARLLYKTVGLHSDSNAVRSSPARNMTEIH